MSRCQDASRNIFLITIQFIPSKKMGWASYGNGELLSIADSSGFLALITADKNMEYQQNTYDLPISVIVMAPLFNRLENLIPLVPSVENYGTPRKK